MAAIETCYAVIGGDLEGVRGRLLTDERILKFLGIFLHDTSYTQLLSSLESGDLKEAFRAAHTMKGISRDLGLTPLFTYSAQLADVLRPDEEGNPAGPLEGVDDLVAQISGAYQITVDAIGALQTS